MVTELACHEENDVLSADVEVSTLNPCGSAVVDVYFAVKD